METPSIMMFLMKDNIYHKIDKLIKVLHFNWTKLLIILPLVILCPKGFAVSSVVYI